MTPKRIVEAARKRDEKGRLLSGSEYPVAERFWRHVAVGEPDKCWLWMGCLGRGGYGSFSTWGKNKSCTGAHRMAWELTNGPVPSGLCVCHRCDNPPCVNPRHLFIGTRTDNLHDASVKGRIRAPMGTTSPNAKLTDEAVREIRRRYALGETLQRELGKEFGVSQEEIGAIVRRRKWRHVA
jgi:hypothetical protein